MAKKPKIEVFRRSRVCYGIGERAILNPVTRWHCKYLQYPKQVNVSYKRLYCLKMAVQQIERLLLQPFPEAVALAMSMKVSVERTSCMVATFGVPRATIVVPVMVTCLILPGAGSCTHIIQKWKDTPEVRKKVCLCVALRTKDYNKTQHIEAI